MYHIIDNQVYDIEALTFWASYGNFTLYTSQGDSIVVSSVADSTGAVTIMVNNASILFDIETANGVVHLIDEVLTFPIHGCMDEDACNYNSTPLQMMRAANTLKRGSTAMEPAWTSMPTGFVISSK